MAEQDPAGFEIAGSLRYGGANQGRQRSVRPVIEVMAAIHAGFASPEGQHAAAGLQGVETGGAQLLMFETSNI